MTRVMMMMKGEEVLHESKVELRRQDRGSETFLSHSRVQSIELMIDFSDPPTKVDMFMRIIGP